MIKAKKKTAEENIQKAIKDVSEKAISSEGKGFCIARVSVGSDNAAMREAVVRVMEQKVTSKFILYSIVFSFVRVLNICYGCAGDGSNGFQHR